MDLFREHHREYRVSHPNRHTLSLKIYQNIAILDFTGMIIITFVSFYLCDGGGGGKIK